MSTKSALILFRKNLPLVSEIEDLISETGIRIKFQTGFEFYKSPHDLVEIEYDREKVIFAYSIDSIIDRDDEEEVEEFPDNVNDYGDTVLEFVTRGTLAGQVVYLIQKAIAEKANAAFWVEGDLVETTSFIEEPISEGLPPELAATLKGSPSERAAAIDAYVARQIPVQSKQNRFKIWFNDNKIEIISFIVLFLGLIIYILVT